MRRPCRTATRVDPESEDRRFESTPEFEITDATSSAIRYLEHGYPSPLVRWHCHNEYELHYIVASSGKVFVGDYIGEFRPGNLILTGPLLPHNWISDTDAGRHYELRDMVVKFEHDTIAGAAVHVQELEELLPMLNEARRGIEFLDMQDEADHYMRAIRESSGPSRFGHFCRFMHELATCGSYEILSTMQFDTRTDEAGLEKVNMVVNFVMLHYPENITLKQVADVAGMNESYFSRFFKKATGNTFSEFLTRIRISKACELLSTSNRQITSICYEVGYNNVANFNRRFLERKHLTPRAYRRQARHRLTRGGTEPTSDVASKRVGRHADR